MPIGSARPQRGFTYLLLLIVIAIGSAALAALGMQWRTALQREREIELLSRGRQIAAAIVAYRNAVPGAAQWPRDFDDLLDDRRGAEPRRHLRRRWADPFTGKVDWVMEPSGDGGFRGVRSRARVVALIQREVPGGGSDGPVRYVSDRYFGVAGQAPAGTPSRPADRQGSTAPSASPTTAPR